jgi:putative sterol carrier protein
MKPEFIAPIALFLCSEECPDSGKIYNAGMGFYNRAAIFTGPGALVENGKTVPTVEDVVANWERISSMDGAREYDNTNDFVGDILPNLNAKEEDSMEKKEEETAAGAGKGLSDVKTVFENMPKVFNVDAASGMDVTFQFSLSGEGGGDWYAEVKGGTCKVQAGIYSNPTSTIKMDAADFLDMIGGTLSAMQAFMSGKLKVEGDIMKAQLIGKLFKF